MSKTYRDFTSRQEFVDYLGLYPKDRKATVSDFVLLSNISQQHYVHELQEILSNIESIQAQWNDQSVQQIEKVVADRGARQLELMQAQKNDKLRAGYRPDQPMYRVHRCPSDSYFYQFAREIGLANSMARYHVQFPGEVTAWHTDIFSPAHEFLIDDISDTDDAAIGRDRNIRRILIALQDWDWGHILMFGKSPWYNWNAGDVIFWPYGVPHGAANMSYSPRISVSITGLQTDKFRDLTQNAINCTR